MDRLFISQDFFQKVLLVLYKNNKTISTAESCTAGKLGVALTELSGSSAYYKGGVIAYSNEAKINLLKVNKETIEKYGAVSIFTAKEMAENCKMIFNTNLAISITGIAGPDGGTPEKPVGTVCFGFAFDNYIETVSKYFEGNRADIRQQSVEYCLTKIIEYLDA